MLVRAFANLDLDYFPPDVILAISPGSTPQTFKTPTKAGVSVIFSITQGGRLELHRQTFFVLRFTSRSQLSSLYFRSFNLRASRPPSNTGNAVILITKLSPRES